MGLDFGWVVNDVRETIWKDDSSLLNVPAGALESWQLDGDASHLRPYAINNAPEVFTFRPLDLRESRHVLGMNPESDASGWLVQILECFRIGVDFPQGPNEGKIPSTGQAGLKRVERVRGMRMLSLPFVTALERRYPGIVGFYGSLIFRATFPSEEEKKASSPSSTAKPSLAVVSTTADTAAADKKDEAAA